MCNRSSKFSICLFDLLKVVNQQKQLDDWCTQKKSAGGEETQKETDKEEDSLDVDNTKTVEVYVFYYSVSCG